MNRFERKRQRFARLLLCVFLPMLLLASVHVHQQSVSTSDACYACLHHIHHDGHLSTTTFSVDSCLLCHFLTTPYVAASVVAVVFAAAIIFKAYGLSGYRIVAENHDAISLRAPPYRL